MPKELVGAELVHAHEDFILEAKDDFLTSKGVYQTLFQACPQYIALYSEDFCLTRKGVLSFKYRGHSYEIEYKNLAHLQEFSNDTGFDIFVVKEFLENAVRNLKKAQHQLHLKTQPQIRGQGPKSSIYPSQEPKDRKHWFARTRLTWRPPAVRQPKEILISQGASVRSKPVKRIDKSSLDYIFEQANKKFARRIDSKRWLRERQVAYVNELDRLGYKPDFNASWLLEKADTILALESVLFARRLRNFSKSFCDELDGFRKVIKQLNELSEQTGDEPQQSIDYVLCDARDRYQRVLATLVALNVKGLSTEDLVSMMDVDASQCFDSSRQMEKAYTESFYAQHGRSQVILKLGTYLKRLAYDFVFLDEKQKNQAHTLIVHLMQVIRYLDCFDKKHDFSPAVYWSEDQRQFYMQKPESDVQDHHEEDQDLPIFQQVIKGVPQGAEQGEAIIQMVNAQICAVHSFFGEKLDVHGQEQLSCQRSSQQYVRQRA